MTNHLSLLERPDPLGNVYLREHHADGHRCEATVAENEQQQQFGLRSAKSIILAHRTQTPAAY